MDYWYIGVWRVYWAACMSAALTRNMTAEEMVALADFYNLVSRGITAIAIAKRLESSSQN